MEGESGNASVKKDKLGKHLQLGNRVRCAKSKGVRLGTVIALEVDGKPDCISVAWDEGKRKKPVIAANVHLVSDETEKDIKECGEKGKKAFNGVHEWSRCRLQDVQIAELRRTGITQLEWRPDQRVAAMEQLTQYGLSFDQLGDDAAKWITLESSVPAQLADHVAAQYGYALMLFLVCIYAFLPSTDRCKLKQAGLTRTCASAGALDLCFGAMSPTSVPAAWPQTSIRRKPLHLTPRCASPPLASQSVG